MGGARHRSSRRPLPARDARGLPRGRRGAPRRRGRPQMGRLTPDKRPEKGLLGSARSARRLRQPAPGQGAQRLARLVPLRPEIIKGHRPRRRPRAARRPLLRQAPRGRRLTASRLQHDGLHGRRDPAHRRGRLRSRAHPAQAASPRSTRPTSSRPHASGATWSPRSARATPTSSSGTRWSIPARWTSSASRRNFDVVLTATCSATS